MAPPLRLEFSGACCHLTVRGDRQEPIIEDDSDRLVFLDLLAREILKQGSVLYAFCVVDNVYHLLLETLRANLVLGMRRLAGVYTPALNRCHARVGDVLPSHYESILVGKESHLLELCRYVVLNPVRAAMIALVREWHWSSYLATLDEIPCPRWLAAQSVLSLFGASARAARPYERFVAEGLRQPSPWED